MRKRRSHEAGDANLLLSNDQTFRFVGTAGFSGSAGELRYEYSKNMTLIHAATTRDGAADFTIELPRKTVLLEDDFIL